MDTEKIREELKKEMEHMRLKFLELTKCHSEFQNIQQRCVNLLEASPDAMIFVNRKARITRVNPRFRELFGYAEEMLVGRDLHLLIPDRYRSRHRRSLDAYFSHPKARPMSRKPLVYGMRRDGSEFPVDVSISPLISDDNLFAVAAVRDMTEKKRSQEEERRRLEQFAALEKISALGRIAANFAHDIRNPLTSVGGFARRLQKIADTEKEREYAQYIISEVGKIEGLMRSILAFSHTRSFLLEDHDINKIIDEALESREERIVRQAITVTRNYMEEAVVRIDRSQVREALDSIIVNAIEAMPDGGTLAIRTDRRKVDGMTHISVLIRDTGEGVPAENLDRIFEPFFTTKLVAEDAGLGLSIAKKIIEDEGGTISLESIRGSGTTVTILFPSVETA
jgi:PAS domain S-box-containing protein